MKKREQKETKEAREKLRLILADEIAWEIAHSEIVGRMAQAIKDLSLETRRKLIIYSDPIRNWSKAAKFALAMTME